MNLGLYTYNASIQMYHEVPFIQYVFQSLCYYIMKWLIGVVIVVVTLATIIVALTISKSIITTESIEVDLPGQGAVLGSIDETLWTHQKFYSFRGVPYAESPSGKLRFKAPISRAPWKGTFDARHFGKRCPDIGTVSLLNSSQLKEDLEDCLSLSIYTKNLDAKQPVMFYIYGGGFYNGSASNHPPYYLLEKDMVLVVVQYRVGALGWLTTLTDEMPGNAPLMDVLLALDWVQKYIHVFGGDPASVTIFGQSAGTAMSGVLLMSPKSSVKHFKRSILQSGSIMGPWGINRAPLQQVESICEALNCVGCKMKQKQHECLERVDVFNLLKVTRKVRFSPVIGDVHGILPTEPKTLLESLNRTASFMMGFTKHDGSFALANTYDDIVSIHGSISKLTVRQFANILIDGNNDYTKLSNNVLLRMLFKQEILDTYNHTAAWPAYIDIANIVYMKSPVIAYANALQRLSGTKDVYMYSFDYAGEHTRFGYYKSNAHYPFYGGVHHTNDNIYLFATHQLNEKDTKFSKKMVDLWYNFAAEGEPRVEDQPELFIPAMETESGPYFHIDKEVTLGSDILTELTATVDDPYNYKLIKS
ncbi:glutactin-like [Eurosta solidaginis]|uniref:glutactin-like n=1 Tax=Eurosta solidaginis TaxID=178769 RepID=UPI003530AC56